MCIRMRKFTTRWLPIPAIGWSGAGWFRIFATEEGRKTFADYHREKLVDHGIDGFKLDECDSSDFTGSWSFPLSAEFPSGLDGEQYHSLFGTLYAKTMLDALGQKTLSEIRQMGALAAPARPLCCTAICTTIGISSVAGQRGLFRPALDAGIPSAETKEECHPPHPVPRLFLPVLINSWNYDGIPWVIFDCEEEVRELDSSALSPDPDAEKKRLMYHATGKTADSRAGDGLHADEMTYAIG